MNYPNLPNSHLEIATQPEVKEITNELLKQLQSALNSNTLFTEQVELSLKGIVRILEVLLSLDFFKNANEIVEYIHKKHAKVGIERLDEDEITAFNFTYPKNAKAIIDYQGIQHALNKHGINSPSVKFSKQPPITYKDIANYRDIVKNADETIKRDNRIISYKQVNGHFVVVEQINRNKSEFIFKTMFKEKGDYKNAPDYKKNIKEND